MSIPVGAKQISPPFIQLVKVYGAKPKPIAVIQATVRVASFSQEHHVCIIYSNSGKSLGLTFLLQFMIHRNLQVGSAAGVSGVRDLFDSVSLLFSYRKLQNFSLKQCWKPANLTSYTISICLKPWLYCWLRFSKYLSIKSKKASVLVRST